MGSLLDKMKKSGRIGVANVLADSVYFTSKETIHTDLPVLNIAFSGDIDGGLTAGVTVVAGESKCYKSFLSIFAMKAYMDKYEDAVVLFYDSEFGIPVNYMESIGIDTSRIIHIPVTNLDELKFDMVGRLEQIERGDKVFIMVDSIGNLASKREYQNALDENTAKDMSRAGDIKSFFRIVTPHVTMKDIPCIVIAHTYKTQAMYPTDVVSGGCLVAGTKVIMANGKLKAIEEIKVGEKVKTRLGNKAVTHIWNPDTLADGTPECLKLIFSDGFKVTCSKTHKFLSPDCSTWIEAKDLKEGSNLAMPDGHTVKVVDITPVGKLPVYDIAVEKAEHYILSNGLYSHNSGVMYSANTVFIITKSQEKEGTEIVGYNFTIRTEKSRFVKEKAKLTFTVLYDSGISKYSGLMDIALESGNVEKPSQGWYTWKNLTTGESSDKKYRLKETFNEEFWCHILEDPKFKKFIKHKYALGAKQAEANSQPE